jgi:hypothetical protein
MLNRNIGSGEELGAHVVHSDVFDNKVHGDVFDNIVLTVFPKEVMDLEVLHDPTDH